MFITYPLLHLVLVFCGVLVAMGGDGKGKGFSAGKGNMVDPRMLGLMSLAGKGAWGGGGYGFTGGNWGGFGGGGGCWNVGKGKGGKGFGAKGMRQQPDGLKVDPALKVWIGNLAPSTKWKDLQTHVDTIAKSKWVEVFTGRGSGTAAVAFASEEDAEKVIQQLNGAELDGQPLVFDTWVKRDASAPGPSEAPPPPPPPVVGDSVGTF
eukprot:TRINITY_DN61572_c0_g1_i1.p1 TRINITY_DN61572_c0_g1~~TRINITY_DN61572_c0_g1_i1.p1  ORF type:complete len:207 (+),score=47.06 TRINITY_DN61572_c0_g1_i1:8-628(+)